MIKKLLPLLFIIGCAQKYPNQKITGELFPSVVGTNLQKKEQSIPNALPAGPLVFLIGYVQDAQFDIDRWLIGLDMTKTEVKVYELPTIAGMFPRMFKTKINEGMRKGIPKPLWGNVITIYKDGEKIQRFTGNTRPNNARVVLLGSDRKIKYFWDGGFSVGELNRLRSRLSEITAEKKFSPSAR